MYSVSYTYATGIVSVLHNYYILKKLIMYLVKLERIHKITLWYSAVAYIVRGFQFCSYESFTFQRSSEARVSCSKKKNEIHQTHILETCMQVAHQINHMQFTSVELTTYRSLLFFKLFFFLMRETKYESLK